MTYGAPAFGATARKTSPKTRSRKTLLLASTALVAATWIATPASAQSVWDGSASTTFSNGDNWVSGGAPLAGDSVLIDQSQAPPNQPTVTASQSIAAARVTGTGSVLTIGAAQTLTVNGLLQVDTNGTLAGTGSVDLNGNTLQMGPGGISLISVSNIVDVGTFNITGSGATGAGTSINVSGAINATGGFFTNNGALNGAAALNVNGGTVVMTGPNGYTGGTNITTGTLALNTATTTLGTGTITFDGTGSGILLAGNPGNVTLTNSVAVAANSTGVIRANTGFTLTQNTGSIVLQEDSTLRFGGGGANGIVSIAPGVGVGVGLNHSVFIDSGTLQKGNGNQWEVLATNFNIAGGAFWDLNGNPGTLTTLSGTGTIQNTNAAAAALTIANSAAATFDGTINQTAGTISLTKGGPGTLTLTAASNYTGGTTINQGILQIINVGALGTGTINMVGGTLQGNVTGNVTNSVVFATNANATIAATAGNTLTFGGAGTFSLFNSGITARFGQAGVNSTVVLAQTGGAGSNAGDVFVDGGTLRTGSSFGAFTISGNNLTVAAGATMDFNDQLGGLGTGARTLNGAGTVITGVNAGTNVTLQGGNFSGGITGGGNLVVSCIGGCAPGGVLTLSGSLLNTYGGTTTVGGGPGLDYTLRGGAAQAFNAASATTITVGSTLDLGGFDQTIGSLAGAGTVTNSGALASLSAGGNNTSTSFTGNILNGGGLRLIKTGTGMLTLSGNNTYAGTTVIDGGGISAQSNTALGSGNVIMNSSVLDYGNGVTLNNPIVLNSNTSQLQVLVGTATQAGNISEIGGARPIEKIGPGTLILSGNNTYTGTTTITGGRLSAGSATGFAANSAFVIGNGATLDLNGFSSTFASLQGVAGSTVDNSAAGAATLTLGSNNATTSFAGLITDTGANLSLVKNGTGTLTLSNANTYQGTTTINQGTVQIANANALGSGQVILNGGALRGVVTGTVPNSNSFTGTGGTISSAAGFTLTLGGSINIASNATARFGTATDTGTVVAAWTGGVVANPFFIEVNGGTLRSGSAAAATVTAIAASMTVAGGATYDVNDQTVAGTGIRNLLGSGTVNIGVNPASVLAISSGNFAGAITGAGGIQVTNLFTTLNGTLTLGGNSNYAGATTVDANHTLVVNGNVTGTSAVTSNGVLTVNGVLGNGATNVTIQGGGSLGGTGTIAGNLIVQDGTVNAGNSPGTLNVAGNMTLNNASISNFELNTPGQIDGLGPTGNDLIIVGGNLTMDGTLNLAQTGGGQVLSGYYQLYQVGGTVSGTFDTVNAGAAVATIYTIVTPGVDQVNALVSTGGQLVQFWDGTDQSGAAAGAQGGTGTWNAANTNWTHDPVTGVINDSWRSQVGVFTGAAGTVTVNGAQNFQGLQFSTTGYIVNGPGTLNMTGNPFGNPLASFLNIDTGVTATINANITGNAGIGLDKFGGGTLILGGTNTYTGTTTINAGTLQLTGGNAILDTGAVVVANVAGATLRVSTSETIGSLAGGGAAGGAVVLDGGTVLTTGGNNTSTAFAGVISGGGGLTKAGAGVFTLSGVNTYTGATTVNGGTLVNAGTLASAVTNNATFNNTGTLNNTLTNNAAGTANNSGTIAGLITNAGIFNQTAGSSNGGLNNTGTVNVSGGAINGAIANNAGGIFNVNGGAVTSNGTFNNATATSRLLVNSGSYTIAGLVTNSGTNAAGGIRVAAGATFNANGGLTNNAAATVVNNGTTNAVLNNAGFVTNNSIWSGNLATNTGSVTNAAGATWTGNANNNGGTLTNSGAWTGAVNNNSGGTFTNNATGTVSAGLNNSATANNAGSISGGVANSGTFGNTGTVNGGLANTAGTTTNTGTINGGANVTGGTFNNNAGGTLAGGLTNSATTNNAGTINGGAVNSGTFTQTAGATNGGFTNTGTVNANGGAINGAVANNAGTFNVGGVVTSDNAFANANGATLAVLGAGDYTIGLDLNNAGIVTIAAGGVLRVTGNINNAVTGVITNNGTVFDDLNNAGLVTNNGVWNGNVATNTGTITNNNTWNGNVASNAGTITNNLTWNGNLLSNTGTVTNAAAGTWTGTAQNDAGGTLVNAGTWVGAVTNAGTFTTTGVVNGAVTNTGTTNAQGTITGAINNNAGTFNVTNALTIGTVLNNAAGATLNANLVSPTTISTGGALAFANAGIFNAGATPGVSVTNVTSTGVQTVTNTGRMNVNGTLNFTGAAGSTFTNGASGLINMANGNVNDRVNVSGTYTGVGGSQITDDINLSNNNADNNATQKADRLTAGTTSGTSNVAFTVQPGTLVALANPITVVSGGAGSTGAFTETGLPKFANTGILQYDLVQTAPGLWQVVSSINVGVVAATATTITSAIATIDASFHQQASALVASAQSQEPNKWSGGPWIRFNAGQTTVDAIGTAAFPGLVTPGTAASRIRTNFAGFQGGFDTGLLNIGNSGWNAHLGITAGLVNASSRELNQVQQGLAFNSKVDFEVPFVGLYAVATYGSFFTDFMVRHDWYNTEVTNNVLNLNRRSLHGDAWNLNGSAGYHFDIGNNWFIEPQIGLSWTRSDFDTLAFVTAGGLNGNITFGTIESLLGRAGFRVGTAFLANDRVAVQPFLTASIWHEFEDSAKSVFNSLDIVNNTVTPVPVSTSRVGTFGQLGFGVSFQVLQTGIVGFVRGDLRFGENIEGGAVVAGGRYTFN